MNGPLAIVSLGFLLGMRHATDPDHVLAVSTIVSRYRTVTGATLIGAAWGVGHTVTVLLVGGGIVLFGWAIPPRITLSFEFAVGVMLVALGIGTLQAAWRAIGKHPRAFGSLVPMRRVALRPHRHGDFIHTHPKGPDPGTHPHAPEDTPLARLDERFAGLQAYQLIRPVVVGVIHGLAGSAAVALVILPAIRSPLWSLFYLVLFGAGTVVGMMIITTVVAWPFATRPTAPFARGLRLASGLASVAFGCFLAYRVGVLDGLFS